MADNCPLWREGKCTPPGGSVHDCSYLNHDYDNCAVFKMVAVRRKGGSMEDQLRAAGALPEGAVVAGGRGRILSDEEIGLTPTGHAPTDSTPTEADRYCDEAAVFAEKGDRKKAINGFRQALQCDPGHAEANYHLACAYLQWDQVQQAKAIIDHLQQAINTDPTHADAHYLLGQLFLTAGPTANESAIGSLRLAIKHGIQAKSGQVNARVKLGKILLEQAALLAGGAQRSLVEEAVGLFRDAAQIDPEIEKTADYRAAMEWLASDRPNDRTAVVALANQVQALMARVPGDAGKQIAEGATSGGDLWRKWRSNLGREPNLRGADLSDLQLTGADFSKADLRGADLSRTKGFRINFDGANLEGAKAVSAFWELASFRGACMRGVDCSAAQVGLLVSGDWTNAILRKTTLSIWLFGKDEASFRGADFTKCTIKAAGTGDSDAAKRFRQSLTEEQRKQLAGCFIATACYGDEFHPDVETLRVFRDTQLDPSPVGRGFIRCYYALSPRIAAHLAHSPAAAAVVRRWILAPIVKSLLAWWRITSPHLTPRDPGTDGRRS